MKWKYLLTSAFAVLMATSSAAILAYKHYGRHLCDDYQYKCVEVDSGDSWHELFPDPRNREIVQRLNRTNQPLDHRNWIVVPNNIDSANYVELSPLPLNRNTGGERLLLIDISDMAFGAYGRNGNLIHWGPISAGESCNYGYCNTPTGRFNIRTQKPVTHESSIFPRETNGGAPMPYAMHYYRGFALHGSPTVPGYHASHGCIRLFTEDAKWLNHQFTDIGTDIVVQD